MLVEVSKTLLAAVGRGGAIHSSHCFEPDGLRADATSIDGYVYNGNLEKKCLTGAGTLNVVSAIVRL